MAELLHAILRVSNVAGLATRELLLGTLDESAPPWFDLACIEILVNRAINSSGVNVKSPARELDY